MSTLVTASEVKPETELRHGDNICHITQAKMCDNGSVSIAWTEKHLEGKLYFGGSYHPNAYFGETINL